VAQASTSGRYIIESSRFS